MAGSKESWEKDIPTWDGSEEKWNTYLEDVEWYFYATSTKDRHLVASRLARKLSGQARNALKGQRLCRSPRDSQTSENPASQDRRSTSSRLRTQAGRVHFPTETEGRGKYERVGFEVH